MDCFPASSTAHLKMAEQNHPTPIVEMRGVVKRFPGVLANNNINIRLYPGEILSLLGENGAGKTTLMNILYGFYRPDGGEIFLRGKKVNFNSPHDAIANGLGMVHQHFMLVPTFTVAENIVLGQPSPRHPLLEDRRQVGKRIRELSKRYGLDVDPDCYVWQLSVGQQQRVEILKALYRGAEVLILDEPTAVLVPQEVEELIAIIRSLADDGHSIIFISHKLHEVMTICDRVAVMRDGELVNVVSVVETNRNELARMMVGREVYLRLEKEEARPGEVVLSLDGVSAKNERGLPALKNISLRVCEGEILAVAGVDGNGQRELEDVISGLRPVTDGQIIIDGQDLTNKPPIKFLEAGLAVVPADRYGTGLLPDFSIAENLVLENFFKPPFTKMGILDQNAINQHAEKLVSDFNIRTPSISTTAMKLSGGNAQKLILARELSRNPKVLLASQPTRGLDVGATEYVHQELVRQRGRGMAILLISTELDEILSLSDRIIVLYEGAVVGERNAGEADVEELGLLMGGYKSDRDESKEIDEGPAVL
jgi:general nucleoside transport system ATP-binding protein